MGRENKRKESREKGKEINIKVEKRRNTENGEEVMCMWQSQNERSEE